jgi:carboxymethylenebutenolidase
MAVDPPEVGAQVSSQSCGLGRFHVADAVSGSESGALPGIVLIHDVWGLSEHSHALAAGLAAEGFAVLEIDLYRRLGEFVIDDPGVQIRSLSDPSVLADLDEGADWLSKNPSCGGRQVGVMGVCMGGTFTVLAACHSKRFSAAAPFYGILSYEHGMLADPVARDREKKPYSPLESADQLRMPMHASFGCDDQLIPQADVDALDVRLAASGMTYEINRYADAGHAFLNHTREEAYRPKTAEAAWARVIAFFREALD